MTEHRYVLGSAEAELRRLDLQAASIDRATRLLLRATGLGEGMRVLDLGTGLGHVSAILAEMVGPEGEVIGLDQSAEALEVAASRAADAGLDNVRFVRGDVTAWRDDRPFDAVVGRLVLFHMPDPVAVLRHHASAVRPGGKVAMIDFDVGAARTEPPTDAAMQTKEWVMAAFHHAGTHPTVGTRLALLLEAAGVAEVASFGVQGYLAPDDPTGPRLLAGIAGTLSPVIFAAGIATEEQLRLDTLEQRIADGMMAADATFLPPTVVGAWGSVVG
ncbi:MAG: class I SAM-dependent methyltransferase [Gaiellales bacterium]|jgi:ubiquinone/menaquinone biosynthesis C-methylase UbiE